jgi:hypothetical protein
LRGDHLVDEVTENTDKTENRSQKTEKRLDEVVKEEVKGKESEDVKDGQGKRAARSKRKKQGFE